MVEMQISELFRTLISNPYFFVLIYPIGVLTFFVVGLVRIDIKYLRNPMNRD